MTIRPAKGRGKRDALELSSAPLPMRPEDLFSRQAPTYARYRPCYPDALFAFLAEAAPARECAWDAGTGSGQAAVSLAGHFRTVLATDASAAQLAQAFPHPRVTYRVARAEASGLEPASADLVTVAQALHWFDLDGFYAEARRVLKPGGLLAAWCYYLNHIDPDIDALFHHFYHEIVGPYWSPRVRHVQAKYQTLAFPFEEVEAPALASDTAWTLADAFGYLESWSSRQEYLRVHGTDPIDAIRAALTDAWGAPGRVRRVRWPLYLRLGRR